MMPLHRRNIPAKEDDASDDVRKPEPQVSIQKKTDVSAPSKSKRSRLILLAIANFLFLGFVSTKYKFKSTSQLTAILATAQLMFIPSLLSLAIGVFDMSSSALPHQRYIPLAAVGTIVGNLLPSYLSSALANLAIVIFGLSSRPLPKKDDEVVQTQQKSDFLAGPLGTVLAAFVMTTMLLIENFCIWVVSATYKASQNKETLPAPLQDNGQLIMRYFFTSVMEVSKKEVVKVRNKINVEWILVSGLGLAIVALEMDGGRMKRSLWGVGKRALYTLGIARGIRTFSFLITVLPSQNPKCYFSHFPTPPPDEWIPWIVEGFVPQANGGCNDLIVSGHATVTSTLACMVTSVVGEPLFTAAIWMFVTMDYMVEVYEGFHYSVDMWLGAILVNFIWNTLASVENSANRRQELAPKKAFIPLQDATISDFMKYSVPAVGSYLQLNGIIPNDYANYTIILYFLAVAYRISKIGFEQYSQHSLICVLFLAIGIYV
ncbi:unnamed protein product [Cylindrotheca closterium]|uniref:Sphingomyelin synthase-like domain-containing protein n=1 Tax=Cylindrotheca closterium TaxID=2856 RepID=A0AAD2PXM0_9STRA|nr:unnamed protein product [Cylindrotheca closterium]